MMLSTRNIAWRGGTVFVRQITRRLQTATAMPDLGVASTASITAAIMNDHRDLEASYNEVVSSTDKDHQQRHGNQFTWELAKHSVGEELVLYPAFEKHLGTAGRQMAETDRKDHREVSASGCWSTLKACADLKPPSSRRSKSYSRNFKT